MTRVALRQYNHEIESLIERGQLDEAVAHCKQILQAYPKYLDTYRLLGKAYLESQRFGEATDIFQRVLASVPDDFVSNIGMSIIREDEGNLDAAIWHMERAFEAQPSNATVQDELRRLFGRRDGLEPPKVRLTRPALARMYARGDLYQQAIAEIRSAMADEPTRLDLKVLMARMSYLSGQRVKATEQSSEILTKFPYCYEANRILAAILPGTSRAEDAVAYKQRVISLDPYAAYLTPEQVDPAEVPDNAVVIERLEYQPLERGLTAQPQWASSLGIDLGTETTTANEALPDWMSGDTQPQQPAYGQFDAAGQENTPAVPFMDDQAAEPAAEIPDWMKAAGWQDSTGEATEQPAAFENEAVGDEEIAPAEIPDWLKSIAPQGVDDIGTQETSGEEDTSAFADLFGGQPEQAPDAPALSADMPDWLKDDTDTQAADPLATTPVPDWMSAHEEKPAASINGEMPDWLRDLAPAGTPTGHQVEDLAEDTAAGEMAVETPEALAPEEPLSAVSSTEDLPQAELPDWLSEIQPPEAAKAEGQAGSSLDWLQDLNAQAEPPAVDDLRTGEIPAEFETDSRLGEESFAAEESLAVEAAANLAEEPPAAEQHADVPAAGLPAEEQPTGAQTAGNLPDWLVGLTLPDVEAPVTDTADDAVQPAVEQVETPVLKTEIAGEAQTVEADQPVMEQAAGDADAAMAWLESLAAKQGALEEELFIKPEDRAETPPEWVSQVQDEPAPMDALQPESEAQPLEAEAQMIEPPAGDQVDTVNVVTEPIPVGQAFQDETDEASEMAVETTVTEGLAESEAEVSAAPLDDSTALTSGISTGAADIDMAWLESLAAKQGALEEELFIKPEDRSETAPAWTQEVEPEAALPASEDVQAVPAAVDEQLPAAPAEEEAFVWPEEPAIESAEDDTEAPTQPVHIVATQAPAQPEAAVEPEPAVEEATPAAELGSEDAAMAWLEGLAAKQGALEEELFVKPEERIETPPEWVSQIQDEPAETLPEAASPLADIFASDEFANASMPEMVDEADKLGAASTVESPEDAMPFAAAVFGPSSTDRLTEAESAPEEETLPDWLKGMEEEVAQVENTADSTLAQTEPVAWQPEEAAPDMEAKPSSWPTDVQPALADNEAESPQADEEDLPAMPAEFNQMDEKSELSAGQQEDWTTSFASIPGDLAGAKQAMYDGNVAQAVSAYNQMIGEGENLDEIIHDLRDSLYHHPVDVTIWQALGDAFIRSNRLQEGLDAYTKAEELLR